MFNLFAKKEVPCPFCYQMINLSKVAFRCNGRGVPGRQECKKTADPALAANFNNSKPYYPVIGTQDGGTPVLSKESAHCTQCGSTSNIRLCPSCHSQLPLSFDANSPMFGLVGVRNSGKTVLLSIMHKELKDSVGRRFNSSIDNPGGAEGLAHELQKNEEAMLTAGRLPEQTKVTSGKQTPAVYEWRYTKPNGKLATSIFSFYDNAGETVSRVDSAMDQAYLAASSGVILLLDPFSFPNNKDRGQEIKALPAGVDSPESVLDAITQALSHGKNLKRGKKIDTPIAVVVTKIDAFFEDIADNNPIFTIPADQPVYDDLDGQTVHDYVASLIDSWGGSASIRKLNETFSNYRFFAVSALGEQPEYGTDRLGKGGVRPLRVTDPILWLMAERGFINKAGK